MFANEAEDMADTAAEVDMEGRLDMGVYGLISAASSDTGEDKGLEGVSGTSRESKFKGPGRISWPGGGFCPAVPVLVSCAVTDVLHASQ